jgi:predicted polyphosphate/ATP-dependent NAD kinase
MTQEVSEEGRRQRREASDENVIVGIIANPAAGKDIRRLVSAASPTSDMAKVGIVRRALVGAIEGGAHRVLIANDHKSLGLQALRGLDYNQDVSVEIIGDEAFPTSFHSRRMAEKLKEHGVGAIVSLGGDGTHRDIAKGWRDVPLVPVSTGTNNVFPQMVEATVAGHAAAVAASGSKPLSLIAHRAKILDVVGDGIKDDLALIDIALIKGSFTASRAVWDLTALRQLVVTTAEPATIGLSSIAARVAPVTRQEFGGVHIRFGPGQTVRAPIAPGLYHDAEIASFERLNLGQSVTIEGPGVLAFDGERDAVLAPGQSVSITLNGNGPWVVDPTAALVVG